MRLCTSSGDSRDPSDLPVAQYSHSHLRYTPQMVALYSHVCVVCVLPIIHFATLRMPRDRALPAFRPVRLPETHGPGTRLLQRSSVLGTQTHSARVLWSVYREQQQR